MFELHHATRRAVDSRTFFQLSRLTAIVQRASPEIAAAYVDDVGEACTEPQVRARMTRLRLLITR